MGNFFVSKNAFAEISCIIHEYKNDNPVVMLLDMASPQQDIFDDLTIALTNNPDSNDLNNIANKSIAKLKNQLIFYLDVAVYERNICQPEYLIDIDGITFVMSPTIYESLSGYSLQFFNKKFILVDVNGSTYTNLLSIMNK